MRHWIFITTVFALVQTTVLAQVIDFKEIYFGTGFALGQADFDKASAVLNLYNEQNSQERSFKDYSLLRGFGAVVGTTRGVFNFELGYTLLQQRRFTTYNDGTDLFQRDARIRMSSFHLGTGLLFTGKSFGFGFNVQGDYHLMNFATRAADDNLIGGESYLTPSREKAFGATVDLRFYIGDMNDHGMRVMIKPYYSFILTDLDILGTAELINGEGSTGQLESTQQDLSHFGVKFIINYAVWR